MYSIQEQFKTEALAQLNSKVRDAQLIAGNILDMSREIGVLNVRTTKASAEMLAGAIQKMLSASNPAEFFQLAAAAMRPDMQVWTSYTEQLRGITDKVTAPVAASLAESEGYVHAPDAAPVESLAPVEEAAPAAAAAEPVAEAVAAPVAPVAKLMPEALVVASKEVAAEVAPVVSEPKPEAHAVMQQMVDTMVGLSKTPAAVIAASAPVAPTKTPVVTKTPVPAKVSAATKTAISSGSRKSTVQPPPQKAGVASRSGASRAKK